MNVKSFSIAEVARTGRAVDGLVFKGRQLSVFRPVTSVRLQRLPLSEFQIAKAALEIELI